MAAQVEVAATSSLGVRSLAARAQQIKATLAELAALLRHQIQAAAVVLAASAKTACKTLALAMAAMGFLVQ
jgi:urease accessory protein UreH